MSDNQARRADRWPLSDLGITIDGAAYMHGILDGLKLAQDDLHKQADFAKAQGYAGAAGLLDTSCERLARMEQGGRELYVAHKAQSDAAFDELQRCDLRARTRERRGGMTRLRGLIRGLLAPLARLRWRFPEEET